MISRKIIDQILLVFASILTTLVIVKKTDLLNFIVNQNQIFESTEFLLPRVKLPIEFNSDRITKINFPEMISGIPIISKYSTIITIGGRKVIWLPIIYNDENIPVPIKSRLINPMLISNKNPYYDYEIGRKSLWFMPEDQWMLYAVIIDPDMENKSLGIGYIHVKRFEKNKYDVLLKDEDDNIIIAARGQIKVVNGDYGQGTLISDTDQQEVLRIYNPLLKIQPSKFVLFSK